MPHKLTCHCGAIELRVTLKNGLENLRRCNCSMCRRRGAIMASVDRDELELVAGHEDLSLYQFNTFAAKHYFCRNCGIYTHHQRRSTPSEYGVNVACIEGVNPSEFTDIPWLDGVNHPADR